MKLRLTLSTGRVVHVEIDGDDVHFNVHFRCKNSFAGDCITESEMRQCRDAVELATGLTLGPMTHPKLIPYGVSKN